MTRAHMALLLLTGHFVAAQEPLTVAEKSEFRATSRHSDVIAFCEALAAKSPVVRFTNMGASGEGRKLPLLILADPPIATPAEAKRSGKLVAYVQANIHAGEVDGKEGLLMLARDIALAEERPLLKNLVLLFCPNFNPDGNDKIDPNNRRSQNGPSQGVGLRANAGGFDLNRDFVKLETPEVRAFARLMNDWDPALVIDCHTTNGSYHRYTLTYDSPRHPNTGTPLLETVRDSMLPEVGRLLEQKTGFKSFIYGNFSPDRQRWDQRGYAATPRYSTHYVGLRGRIGILSESYNYAPYKNRITASREFVRSWLEYLSVHSDRVRKLLLENNQGDSIAVRTNVLPLRKDTILGYEEEMRGERRVPLFDKPKGYEVDVVTLVEPAERVAKPYAYLFPARFKTVLETLERHGITVETLTEPMELAVEPYFVEKIVKSERVYQKHNEVRLDVSRRETVRVVPRRIEAGTLVVRTTQPLGTLAAYLLEPRSEDGLTTWNFFDDGLEVGGEFPVVRLLRETPLKLAAAIHPEKSQNSP